MDATGPVREIRRSPAAIHRMELQVGDVRHSGQVCLSTYLLIAAPACDVDRCHWLGFSPQFISRYW